MPTKRESRLDETGSEQGQKMEELTSCSWSMRGRVLTFKKEGGG